MIDIKTASMPTTEPKIGTADIARATEILKKYKRAKTALEKKIVRNEEYFKMRQWGKINPDGTFSKVKSTPWLFSCLQNRHADVMDNYPTCNIQPRQEDDKNEAMILSEIIPVILKQNDYEDTYHDISLYLLKQGGCVQAVMWNPTKHNGLGDIEIRKVDILNFYYDPSVSDIQDSPNVFVAELVDKSILEQRYPDVKDKLGSKELEPTRYLYDDSIDTSDKVCVIDWYYKTENNGKKALHYVKFAGNVVLYATENMTERPTAEIQNADGSLSMVEVGESLAEKGLYDHAKYPFVTTGLNKFETSLFGAGIIDIARDTQDDIDELNACIVENAIDGSMPRYFSRIDGAINEAEYLDRKKRIVHVEGSLDERNVMPIETKALGGIYVSVLNQKIEEMKYTTSNQDANNGVAPSGITAGSAISALQEVAGKVGRLTNMTLHRSFREVVYFTIELIRQFYDMPREFRISPKASQEAYVMYSNKGIKGQHLVNAGNDMGFRVPEFDIEVTSEKQSPYKKMEINELALQLYGAGFFNPDNTTQALSCLNIMDFQKKDDIVNIISQNGTMQEQLLQFEQIALSLAQRYEPEMAQKIAVLINGQSGMKPVGNMGESIDTTMPNSETAGEHPFNTKARAEARASTQVD